MTNNEALHDMKDALCALTLALEHALEHAPKHARMLLDDAAYMALKASALESLPTGCGAGMRAQAQLVLSVLEGGEDA